MRVDPRVQGRGGILLPGSGQRGAHIHPRVVPQGGAHQVQGGRAGEPVAPLGELVGIDLPRGGRDQEQRRGARVGGGLFDVAHVAVPRGHALGRGARAAHGLGEVVVEHVREEQVAVAALDVARGARSGARAVRGLGRFRGGDPPGARHSRRPRAHVGLRRGAAGLGHRGGGDLVEIDGDGSGLPRGPSWRGVGARVPHADGGGRQRGGCQQCEGREAEAVLPRLLGHVLVEDHVAEPGFGFFERGVGFGVHRLPSSAGVGAAPLAPGPGLPAPSWPPAPGPSPASSAARAVARRVEEYAGTTVRRTSAS